MRIPHKIYPVIPWRLPNRAVYSNYALDFKGDEAEDYVNVPYVAAYDITDEITVGAWVNARIGTMNVGLAWKAIVWKGGCYVLFYDGSADRIGFHVYGPDVTSDLWVATPGWHYVEGYYDGTRIGLRVDGEEYGTPNVATGAITTNTNPINIGGVPGVERWFNGLIDEPFVMNRATSLRETRENFYRGYSRAEPNHVMCLRFEEGKGLTARDSSPVGNNGTLNPAGDPPEWTRVALYELLSEGQR